LLKKIIFVLLIFVTSYSTSFSETYYISNSGSDSFNGNSPIFPWKTIDKLNSVMNRILPGDVILFERGGYFTGQILLDASGSIVSPVIFGAYGEGKSPVISGAVPIRNWSVYKGNIYKAETDTVIKNLFVNGAQKTLARYPNNGFLTIKEPFPKPNNGLFDSKLKQPKDYWKGSNVRIRTVNWAYEYSPVFGFANGNITFSKPTLYPIQSGYGYYLDNNFKELDYENEWFFGKGNTSKGLIYYYPKNGSGFKNELAEGSVYGSGFISYKNLTNIIIRDLEIRNQSEYGIYFSGSKSNIKIENCTFSGQLLSGITMINNSMNCEITNCRFYDINGKAVYLLNSVSSVISDNIFNNSGMIPGYGSTGDAFGMSAIVMLNSDSNFLNGNNINNTGHDGINCIGKGNITERNVVTNSMLLLNDGGAIKSYGLNTSGSVWKNNFAVNTPGNLEATFLKYNKNFSAGMYLDEYCNNMKILDNTIVNSGMAGIYLHNNIKNVLVKGNICYNNPAGIYFLHLANEMSGNSFNENVFFGVNPEQVSVMSYSAKGKFIPGKFESNYYANPENDALFVFESGALKTGLNISGFKKQLSNNSDLSSKVLTGPEFVYSKLFYNMSDDTATVLLSSDRSYFDIDMKSVYGSVTLLPYTSKVLVSDKKLDDFGDLNIAGGPLNYGNVNDKNFSGLKWYKIFAENLNDKITVTAPEGFEISLYDDSGFGKLINLNPVSGKVEKIIFVRFAPDDKKGYFGFISNVSGNIKSNVKVYGNSR
jgi:parallel beta-helix repeat protein